MDESTQEIKQHSQVVLKLFSFKYLAYKRSLIRCKLTYFQSQVEIFVLLKDKQVNQMMRRLATVNLCNFLYVIEFAGNIMLIRMAIWKRENKAVCWGKRQATQYWRKPTWKVRMPGLKSWLCNLTVLAGHSVAPSPLFPHL